MNLQNAQERIGKRLVNVSEVASGVLRGVRRRGEQDFAAYVFDLNNHLPETVGSLNSYLDEVIGQTYFDEGASPDLRWNNYLYFVVGREAARSPDFSLTKSYLEADRCYARKYVVFEDEFDRVLEELDSVAVVDKSAVTADIVQSWSESLGTVGLEDILDGDRPIANIVRNIATGTAKQSVRTRKTSGLEASHQLVSAHLASLDLSSFRPYPRRKYFEGLGKANLLFGSNGVGKTSLLESLEFLFCGANRRSPTHEQSSVEGHLASGVSVKTSGIQSLSDFKTRQRLWYGSDDTSRQNKLPNQFARFNFLNTDAAAELYLLKGDPGAVLTGNADSLAALLSGHEATLIWRRIQDVRKAIAEDIRAKRSVRAVAESDQKAKEQEINSLEAIPGQSDAAFAVFLKDLERIGWQGVPKDKQLVSEQLVESLSDLTSQLGVVRQLNWLRGPITEASAAEYVQTLLPASEAMREELAHIKTNEQRRSILAKRQSLAESRKAALAAVAPAAVEELVQLSESLQRTNDELVSNTKAFSALPTIEPPEGWETMWGSKTILEAHNESEKTLNALHNEITESQQRLTILTSTQSQLQNALVELHDWARKVVEHRHSDANCPVCGTEFGPGELLHHMESLVLAPSDTAASELKHNIEQLINRQKLVTQETTWLEQLEKFSRVIADSRLTVSVSAIQRASTTLIERQKTLLNARHSAKSGIDGYSRAGLSLEAVRKLCTPLEGDDQPETGSLNIAEAAQRIEKYLRDVREEITVIDKDNVRRNAEARRHLASAAIDSEQSLSSGMDLVLARLRQTQGAIEVCYKVRRFLRLVPSTDLMSLYASLEAAVLGAKTVLAAIQSDNNSETHLKSLRTQLEQVTERLSVTRGALERLAASQRVLDDIIENQSLDDASAAVVAATHTVADSIFSRIHAPAEYQVTAEAFSPLRRRDNNAAVQLNEVSTGQRAAYALSMFLAMNAQVKEGPKVILLDDPISHIDDLNALSFLDYLRNLVLKSDRQLFFATADEKIAGLFAHKFGFLGQEFRTIELARS